MNGPEPKIEIFNPFGEAFELMKKILFQPFDITKWLVIGFAAFLARFSTGFHTSFNPVGNFNGREDRKAIAESIRGFTGIDQMEWWLIALIVAGVLVFLALVIVLMWLGARGRFIFTDCIVYNRGAIVAPWKEFRIQGNSFFLFSLLVALVVMVLIVVAAFALVLPMILQGNNARPGIGFWIGLGLFLFFVLSLSIGWAVISQLMVPIMYRQRCLARQAFAQSVKLITDYPGPILLYFLFLIVIVIASAMISCLAACLTCCIAAIPYVGTVILLPIPVTLCGFALFFLRQFGPDYDVWAGIPQPEPPPISSPPPLPIPPPLQT